jgi:hypothetical protein
MVEGDDDRTRFENGQIAREAETEARKATPFPDQNLPR